MEILEYCAPEKCIKRKQHYLNLLKPEYNILNTAGSLLGFKHSNETKAKISAYLKTLYANLKFKAKRLEQLKRLHSNPEQQAKRLEHSYASKVKRVSVLDTKKNETTIYPSISEASQAIGCTKSTISIALKYQQDKAVLRLVKKKYVISHLKEADSSVVSGACSASNYVCNRGKIKQAISGSCGHSKWEYDSLPVYKSSSSSNWLCTCGDL